MKQKKRQLDILKELRAVRRELMVNELAKQYRVSQLTIRRDLENLEKEGALIRTHGGCVAIEQTGYHTLYHDRIASKFKHKQAIGQRAAQEVKQGDAILISDGSTTFHLASNLNGSGPVTVFTNSIAMVNELSRNPGIDLHILGGHYNKNMHYMGGSMTEQMLEMLTFDIVFIGADAVDAKGRCHVANPIEARTIQIMMNQGRRNILLADHAKVEANSHVAYATLEKFDTWITTKGIKKTLLKKYIKMVNIVEAEV